MPRRVVVYWPNAGVCPDRCSRSMRANILCCRRRDIVQSSRFKRIRALPIKRTKNKNRQIHSRNRGRLPSGKFPTKSKTQMFVATPTMQSNWCNQIDERKQLLSIGVLASHGKFVINKSLAAWEIIAHFSCNPKWDICLRKYIDLSQNKSRMTFKSNLINISLIRCSSTWSDLKAGQRCTCVSLKRAVVSKQKLQCLNKWSRDQPAFGHVHALASYHDIDRLWLWC